MSNNQLLASDSFASGSLAAGWGPVGGFSKSQVIGSGPTAVTEANTLNVEAGQIWTGITWPSDQISEFTATTLTANSSTFVTMYVRMNSAASRSGYAVQLINDTANLYRADAGSFTLLKQVTGLTFATGDIWTLQVVGACLTLYQNFKIVLFGRDATYASGSPGYSQGSNTALTASQVSSWRGYSATQQDGIWQKQGCIIIPTAAQIAANSGNSGTMDGSRILYEGNAQILSGTVFKMWFGTGTGIAYAESSDGYHWTQYTSNPVIANFWFPDIIKVGSTYYLYCMVLGSTTGDIYLFTGTDGVNWSQQSSTIKAKPASWSNLFFFKPVFVDGNGIWHALYSGNLTSTGVVQLNLATSPDGLNWVDYGSNPVLTGIWPAMPILINGVWYMWGEVFAPGLNSNLLDPVEGVRVQSVDLINWTNKVHSIHRTQFTEGVGYQSGGAYPDYLISVGGKTLMFYDANSSDTVNNTGSIWQINLAVAPAPLSSIIQFNEDAVSQVASDNFSYGPGNLNGNWTMPTGGTALKIVSGPYVEPTMTSTLCEAVYTGANFSPNQYSEATIQALTGTLFQSILFLTVRASTSALTAYEALIGSPTATMDAAAYIGKRINGTASQIGPTTNIEPQVGDVWRLSVVTGSDGFPVLSLFQNGNLVVQVQDQLNSIATGNPGFELYSSLAIGDAQISSWAGGNANVIPSYATGAQVSPFLVGL